MASSNETPSLIPVASIGWQPSAARTIRCSPFSSVGFANPKPPAAFTKAPGDDVDFSVDLTDWIADDCDPPVLMQAPTVSPSGQGNDAAIVWGSFFGNLATVLLSGGEGGQTYTVAFTIITAAARKKVFQIPVYIDVLGPDCAPTPPALFPPNALALDDGTVLLTDDGAAIILS